MTRAVWGMMILLAIAGCSQKKAELHYSDIELVGINVTGNLIQRTIITRGNDTIDTLFLHVTVWNDSVYVTFGDTLFKRALYPEEKEMR
ncbi:hypothetical protein C4561_01430 [candidate division WWE3 bacterium]|uniref:Uncharacterized protein n=1 Tax=candidate division WWE3 bacterium TaxID=2053526 RepID=A0A3A4ZEY8_UNCKA|nr:MAG: hypothetical protein C4561_01430 [candidate division WWE3 bacterium]